MTRSDSTVLVTRLWLDQVMILTRLEKNLDDSDSRGLWLWLDKNDSDTSLLNLTKKMGEDMAYYIPTVWKSGGTRPRVSHLIAPMLTTGSESTKNRSSSSPFTRSSCNNKSGTSEWIASVCGEYTVLYGFHFWKFIKRNRNNSSVLGYLASLILYVPPLMKNKKTRSTQTWSGFHEKTGHCEKWAKQFQGNFWPGISNTICNNFTKLFSQRDVSRINRVMYSSKISNCIVTEID